MSDDAPQICPACKGPLPQAVRSEGPATARWPHFPFCSDRCRLVDLGKWFRGEYLIPGAPAEPDDDGVRAER